MSVARVIVSMVHHELTHFAQSGLWGERYCPALQEAPTFRMSSSVRGTGGRFQALAMIHHVFHSASLGFLEDWAYMSFSRSMISWSSSLVMVLSRARFMLPRPRDL